MKVCRIYRKSLGFLYTKMTEIQHTELCTKITEIHTLKMTTNYTLK